MFIVIAYESRLSIPGIGSVKANLTLFFESTQTESALHKSSSHSEYRLVKN